MAGAREHAKKAGLQIVYDKNYPPNTIDYTPIVRAIKATNPDLVFVASYPADSAGILRAVEEQGLTAKMFGGPIIGLQYGSIKQQMGERLNGIVDYELFVHEPTMNFPGVDEFIKRLPGARQGGRHRPARLLRAAAGLCDISRCWSRRSRARNRSTMRNSPSTCTRRSSRRSWATSSSAPTANGPSRAS